MSSSSRKITRASVAIAALALLVFSVLRLEQHREGIARGAVTAGETPATLYSLPRANGPLVVIAHGFAGSRQLMEAFSLTLARDGYAVLAYDLEGHGSNPVPMGGDVTTIDGTTARLVLETLRVIAKGREVTGWSGPVALIGHSMASDVVIRAAQDEGSAGPVVAVSMFSGAVTAEFPRALLVVTGEWEARLRAEALRVLQMVDPEAHEDETVTSGDITRQARVAPLTEHVSVLYSETTLEQTRNWLNRFYDRAGQGGPVVATGGPIVTLLLSIVALGYGLAGLLPVHRAGPPVKVRPFLVCAVLLPAITPLIATQFSLPFLPVLVADYITLHLAILGLAQLTVLWWAGAAFGTMRWLPMAALLSFGLLVFGVALDRYVASFMPTGARLGVLSMIACGAVPFMIADAILSEAGHAALWRRALLRLGFLSSLVLAVALDFERLMFLVIILPVIVLYFAIFGLMGRWVGLRSGPLVSGLALGIILAWSLASSFPLFDS